MLGHIIDEGVNKALNVFETVLATFGVVLAALSIRFEGINPKHVEFP